MASAAGGAGAASALAEVSAEVGSDAWHWASSGVSPSVIHARNLDMIATPYLEPSAGRKGAAANGSPAPWFPKGLLIARGRCYRRGVSQYQVGPETIVHVDYRLFDAEGALVESGDPEIALAFLFGYGQVVPGIENALLGAQVGDVRELRLAAEEAFGQRDPERVFWLDREGLPQGLEVGDELEAEDEGGDVVSLTVLELDEDGVLVDANHPLAGQTVRLEMEVTGVRPARGDELEEAQAELEARQFEAQRLLPATRLLRRPSGEPAGLPTAVAIDTQSQQSSKDPVE